MHKKINCEQLILWLGIALLLFETLFLYWLNPVIFRSNKINSLLIPVSVLLIILQIKKRLTMGNEFFACYALIIYIMLNYYYAPYHESFFITLITNNILPIMILIFFKYASSNINFKENLIKFLFIFFNIFNIINTIIIILQINIPYFMMPFYNLADNKFYLDHLTGFFGMNGTHVLSIFNIIVIYLDFLFLKYNNNHQKFALICLIFTIVSSIYVSGYNDNKSYYFMLILYIIPLIFQYILQNKRKKKIIKIMSSFACLFVIFFVIVQINPTLRSIFYDRIYNDLILVGFNAAGTDSDERIQLFLYSLDYTKKYPYGVGIGGINEINDMPPHMGISELSAKTYTGGLAYLVLFIFIFYYYFIKISNLKSRKHKFMIIAFLLFAVYYQQLFINSSETVLYCLLIMIVGCYFQKSKIANTEEIIE